MRPPEFCCPLTLPYPCAKECQGMDATGNQPCVCEICQNERGHQPMHFQEETDCLSGRHHAARNGENCDFKFTPFLRHSPSAGTATNLMTMARPRGANINKYAAMSASVQPPCRMQSLSSTEIQTWKHPSGTIFKWRSSSDLTSTTDRPASAAILPYTQRRCAKGGIFAQHHNAMGLLDKPHKG